MNNHDLIVMRRYLRKENARFTDKLQIIPNKDWPALDKFVTEKPDAVYRSNKFLVQVYRENPVRLSICRTEIQLDGQFKADISWEELQAIKEQIYPGLDAVEVYPPQKDVVNVANFRHLWIMLEPLPFAWRTKS